jgi:hypothetical protein
LAIYNYRHHKRLHRDFDGYSIRTAAAHMFGIVIVYTTLPEQRRQLTSLGFEVDTVFGSRDGQRIPEETQTSDAWWFHFIARKPRSRSDMASQDGSSGQRPGIASCGAGTRVSHCRGVARCRHRLQECIASLTVGNVAVPTDAMPGPCSNAFTARPADRAGRSSGNPIASGV